MLSQVNYRVPNMRFLREKLPVTSSYFTVHHRLPVQLPFQCDVGGHGLMISTPPLLCVFKGLRVEERGRVLLPVCAALPQPHV